MKDQKKNLYSIMGSNIEPSLPFLFTIVKWKIEFKLKGNDTTILINYSHRTKGKIRKIEIEYTNGSGKFCYLIQNKFK